MESHISLEGILGGGGTQKKVTAPRSPRCVFASKICENITIWLQFLFGIWTNLGEMHCWNPSDTVDGQNPTRIEIFKTFKTLLYFILYSLYTSYLNWFAGCPSIVLKSKIQKRTWFRCISSQVQNVCFFHEQQKHFTNAICRTIVGWRWFVNQQGNWGIHGSLGQTVKPVEFPEILVTKNIPRCSMDAVLYSKEWLVQSRLHFKIWKPCLCFCFFPLVAFNKDWTHPKWQASTGPECKHPEVRGR